MTGRILGCPAPGTRSGVRKSYPAVLILPVTMGGVGRGMRMRERAEREREMMNLGSGGPGTESSVPKVNEGVAHLPWRRHRRLCNLRTLRSPGVRAQPPVARGHRVHGAVGHGRCVGASQCTGSVACVGTSTDVSEMRQFFRGCSRFSLWRNRPNTCKGPNTIVSPFVG